MVQRLVALLGLSLALAAAAGSSRAADPIRIALIEESGGAQLAASSHGEQGFRLGLAYATSGTLAVHGRPIELALIETQGDPAAAASLLASAYREGNADVAVGLGSSDAAYAMAPVAASFKRILLLAHAPAGPITGGGKGRYVFRTAASADQFAVAEALALARPELNLFVAGPDTRGGRDAVAALKAALESRANGTFFIGSRLVPPRETDIGGAVSSEFEGFHDLHGAKTLLTVWPNAAPPIQAIATTSPGRFGIRLAFAGDIAPTARLPALALEGVTSYFHTLPRNRVNDWLLAAWRDCCGEAPDGCAAAGMTAAIALVAALETAPAIETEALIATLEGLRFESPKGGMIIRSEDHQTLQVMYHVRSDPQEAGGLPVLVHEFAVPELPLPIRREQD